MLQMSGVQRGADVQSDNMPAVDGAAVRADPGFSYITTTGCCRPTRRGVCIIKGYAGVQSSLPAVKILAHTTCSSTGTGSLV
jgi:hypothetical protein